MMGKMRFTSLLCGTVGVVALASGPARAGGFGLSVALPPTGANARDAVLTVQPEGCRAPGATVSARAEGLVNGRRRSLPLQLTLASTDANGVRLYSLRRQWPTTGTWVLAFTGTSLIPTSNGKSATINCRALLELGPNGSIPPAQSMEADGRRSLRLRYLTPETDGVETALRELAARANRNAALVGRDR